MILKEKYATIIVPYKCLERARDNVVTSGKELNSMEKLEKYLCDNNVPAYTAGEVNLVDCGDECVMIYVKDAPLDGFVAYCTSLEAAGFEKVSCRAIEGNEFKAYVKGDVFVYAYHTKYNDTARIVVGPIAVFGYEDCGKYEEKYAPKFAMVGQPTFMNCGQGYIFLLPDGRLLVQDGGSRYAERPDYMYKAMREVAPDPDNIVIAAWFHSHAHGDHQDGYEEFIENHGSDVKIEKIIVNYPPAEISTYTRRDGVFEDGGKLVDSIHEKTAKFIPNAQLVKPHTGQIFEFGSVKVEILFTIEDYLPTQPFDYINSTSLVIRIIYKGQSILLLADTTHSSGRILENLFGDYLKSDMVQLAHHGMWASNMSLYDRAKASVVLFPNTKQGIKNNGSPWYNDKVVVGTLEYATDLYVSGTELVTIVDIPYTHVNNKNEVLELLKA